MPTLRDIMNPAVITLGADMSVGEAEGRLARHRISGAPVLQGGRVIGVVSTRDLRAAHDIKPATDAPERNVGESETAIPTVKDIMTRRVVALPPAATVDEAADLMRQEHVHRVLVMQGDYLLGVVSTSDIARATERADSQAADAATSADEPATHR